METTQTTNGTATQAPERSPYTLWQLVRYFLRLGTLGFGGPVALVGYDWPSPSSVQVRWLPNWPCTWATFGIASWEQPWWDWPLSGHRF